MNGGSELDGAAVPKLALVGCGAIAEHLYLPALRDRPAVLRHLLLVDPSAERTGKLSELYPALGTAQHHREIVDRVDAAILAVPNHLHHPIALDLLAGGVHVLCEKPLADSAEHALEMVETADSNEVILCANYLQRLYPCFATVRKIIASGEHGAPLEIDYRVGELFDWPTVSGFYFQSASGTGVLRDRGAHVLDHVCWWLEGAPEIVSSRNDAFGGSEAVAALELSKGNCKIEVRVSWLAKTPCTFSVRFASGAIEGEVYDFDHLRFTGELGSGRRKRLGGGPSGYVAAASAIIDNFVDAVMGRAEPLVPAREILPSMELADRCYERAARFDLPWYAHLVGDHGHR